MDIFELKQFLQDQAAFLRALDVLVPDKIDSSLIDYLESAANNNMALTMLHSSLAAIKQEMSKQSTLPSRRTG